MCKPVDLDMVKGLVAALFVAGSVTLAGCTATDNEGPGQDEDETSEDNGASTPGGGAPDQPDGADGADGAGGGNVVTPDTCAFGAGSPPGEEIVGSGNAVELRLDLADFSRIEASCVFKVQVLKAAAFQVTVSVDDNLADYLDIRVTDGGLVLAMKAGTYMIGRDSLRVHVEMPALDGLNLSGAAQLSMSGFTSDRPLEIEASGVSSARGDITAGETTVSASGTGEVQLTGTGTTLSLLASGAASVDLQDYPVAEATVDLSGVAENTVNVSESIRGTASGASRLGFTGNPGLVDVQTSGTASVGPL
jgi:predicted small secreted protein